MSPYGFPDAMVKMTLEAAAPFRLLKSDPDEAVRRREKLFGITFTQDQRKAFLANDGEAVVAMLEAQFEVAPLTDTDLGSISQPCLVFCGELDPFSAGAKNGASHMPNVEFVSLAGLNHMSAFAPQVVLPHIKDFLARVSKT
jgi:pimeloyl-ACP methyl ester carboxylesterase